MFLVSCIGQLTITLCPYQVILLTNWGYSYNVKWQNSCCPVYIESFSVLQYSTCDTLTHDQWCWHFYKKKKM